MKGLPAPHAVEEFFAFELHQVGPSCLVDHPVALPVCLNRVLGVGMAEGVVGTQAAHATIALPAHGHVAALLE